MRSNGAKVFLATNSDYVYTNVSKCKKIETNKTLFGASDAERFCLESLGNCHTSI